MLRRLHLILAALAIVFAPLAMQSGMAMAATPVEHGEMAQSGHCGDEVSGGEDESGALVQCCIATCSAVAPLGTATIDLFTHEAPLLVGFRSSEYRSFQAELATPPPRNA